MIEGRTCLEDCLSPTKPHEGRCSSDARRWESETSRERRHARAPSPIDHGDRNEIERRWPDETPLVSLGGVPLVATDHGWDSEWGILPAILREMGLGFRLLPKEFGGETQVPVA